MRHIGTNLRVVAGAAAAALLLTACGSGTVDDATDGTTDDGDAAGGPEDEEQETIRGESAPADRTALTLWTHAAGNPEEFAVIQSIIDAFNDSQDEWFVEHEAFPQGSYNDSVLAGALAGNLPDILDVDGPIVPNWAWAGYLAPLELGDELYDQYIDGAKGIYQDEVYSLGFWDVTTGLFSRRSVLEDNGIRVATVDEPWTKDEFDDALETLAASGEFDYSLDLGAAWDGEWPSYAWSPWLQSFGGDLIDRETYTEAEGVLNGPEAVEWGEYFQSLFSRDLAAPGPADPERTGFESGDIAIMYDGIWRGASASEAFDDVVFMPPPDFGNGPVSGVGSWQWAISEDSDHKDGARAYLEFAFTDEHVAEFASQVGLIPATESALELVPEYSAEGEFGVFFDWADEFGLIRPATPAYLVISSEFEKAAIDIAAGADVQRALDAAVDAIESDIEQNNGYGY
jgi:multiple sugar transport system substrate-binding protein